MSRPRLARVDDVRLTLPVPDLDVTFHKGAGIPIGSVIRTQGSRGAGGGRSWNHWPRSRPAGCDSALRQLTPEGRSAVHHLTARDLDRPAERRRIMT